MYLMFPAAIATSFAFMLPVATGSNAIVFSYGYVNVVDMVVFSIIFVLYYILHIYLYKTEVTFHSLVLKYM